MTSPVCRLSFGCGITLLLGAIMQPRPGIPIYRVTEKLPLPNTTVIVAGGLAMWTGTKWLTMSEPDVRIIEWEVLWWAPLPSNPDPDSFEV